MEAVGFCASIVTILEVTKTTLAVLRRFRDAPKDHQRLVTQVQLMTCQIQVLSDGEVVPESIIPLPTLISLKDSLSTVRSTVESISRELSRLTKAKKVYGFRFNWAVVEKSKAKDLLDDLQSIESTLGVVIGLLLCRYSKNHLDMQRDFAIKLDALSEMLNTANRLSITDRHLLPQFSLSPSHSKLLECDQSRSSDRFKSRARIWNLSDYFLFWFLCLAGSSTLSKTDTRTLLTISLIQHLPFRFVMIFDLYLRLGRSRRISMSLPVFKKVASCDTPFLSACIRGDVFGMRLALQQTPSSWYHIAEGNLTPMYFAIESGKPEAVRFLIDQGHEIDSTFGDHQTSALAWALFKKDLPITREILEGQPDILHVSAFLGWSPVYYLWDHSIYEPQTATDFLLMLQTVPGFSFSHQGFIDVDGYSLMNRVAIMGVPADIKLLVKLRADMRSTTGPLQWNTLQEATWHGRLDNLEALLPFYPEFSLEERDPRGWTLLHLAAAQGHEDIVRFLLGKGADWQALSTPAWAETIESLRGKACTPAEVAYAVDIKYYHRYRRALEDIRSITIAELPDPRVLSQNSTVDVDT